MKDIDIIDIDYSAKKPEYKKEDKVDIAKISAPWIVPEEGPVYGDNSLRVIRGGRDLIRGKDWEPSTPVTNLSELTGKPVYLYVELKDHILASGGEVELVYQRVGMPQISVKTLLTMLEEMVIQGKPVDWDTQITGKPKTYYPAWHSHDIKNPNELIGFGGLVELFSMFTFATSANGAKISELLKKLQDQIYNELNYTQKLLWGSIMTHSRNYKNPHELKPGDVDLGNVANFATATPQQDADGLRADLYSTPAGLNRVIDENAPDSSDYLIQSELPFGYYGSGIYLPPPITGSFEGLGGDWENSAFCREGNGWLVGLIRAFDGRVKNLYYVYKTDLFERNHYVNAWLHTYVQYKHPTITAAGKDANYVINGSNYDVLAVGSVKNPENGWDIADDDMWICLANSTFDPNSHTLKKTNIKSIGIENGPGGRDVARAGPGQMTISRVGNWVYLICSYNTTLGDTNLIKQDYTDGSNYQQRFFRFPYKDLLDNTKDTVTFVPVNVTYDNLLRQRRSGQSMYMMTPIHNAAGDGVVQYLVKYNPAVSRVHSHRRRQFFMIGNPDNPRQARLRVMAVAYTTMQRDGVNTSDWRNVYVDYDWDVETNTLTLSPHWYWATVNLATGGFEASQEWRTWNDAAGAAPQFMSSFTFVAGSHVPGFGYVAMVSSQTGTPPYGMSSIIYNRDGNPLNDYKYMFEPPNWFNQLGQHNTYWVPMILRSPFGVSGFPRYYADVYEVDGANRSTPIEIFYGEKENQEQGCFYRITEGGIDDNYDYRDALQSKYIPKPIYGRKTNSSFGQVAGITYNTPLVNRPRVKDRRSRETGLFNWVRRDIQYNPGVAHDFSQTMNDNGGQEQIRPGSDGSIVINLAMQYNMDPLTKVLVARPRTDYKLRIPRSIWNDLITNALGAHYSTCVDICASFYICQDPGTNNGQPYCMFQIQYHKQPDYEESRCIIGIFNWDVERIDADGIRVMRMGAIEYPFYSKYSYNEHLAPPSISPSNRTYTRQLRYGVHGQWDIYTWNGLTIKYAHMEILDYPGEGPRNFEQVWFNGIQLGTVGNANTSRVYFSRRNNTITEGSYVESGGQAFNEYGWQVQANPQWGMCSGIPAVVSGGAIDLLTPWNGNGTGHGWQSDKLIMLGATYVEGNWSLFVNADVNVTFNGFSTLAKMTNWDLRDLTDVYRNQTFYVYCVANGSTAKYEVSKVLRPHSAASILVATVKTNTFGITTIDPRQSFTISGFPLTRARDMGVPVSSGAITEAGAYQFLKRSDLYNN